MVPIACAIKPFVTCFIAGRPSVTSWCVSTLVVIITGRPFVIILVVPGHVNITRTSLVLVLHAI